MKAKKWWPFGAKSQPEVKRTGVLVDLLTDIPSNEVSAPSNERSSETSLDGAEERAVEIIQDERDEGHYKRDLSLGGVVLLGIGAKRVFLHGLLIGHPVLFAITASTTVVTGYGYLRGFWDGMTSENHISGNTLAGTLSVATLPLGYGVPALTGVWLLNLAGYLRARAANEGDFSDTSEAQHATMQGASERVAKVLSFASWGVVGANIAHYVTQPKIQLAWVGTIHRVLEYVRGSRYGPLMYVVFYGLQPPFFLSEGLLTTASGFLFGPVWGIAYAIVGSNLESFYSYALGRYFGPRILDKLDAKELVERYGEPIRKNPFETIVTMRLLFVPHDVVSCLAGTLQVDWKTFVVASALGSLPTTISLVLFGASMNGLGVSGRSAINPATLAASGAIFISSIGISRYLKREKEEEEQIIDGLSYLGAT